MRRKATAVRYVWSCSVEENSPGFALQGFSEPLYVKIECDSILCLPGLDI